MWVVGPVCNSRAGVQMSWEVVVEEGGEDMAVEDSRLCGQGCYPMAS